MSQSRFKAASGEGEELMGSMARAAGLLLEGQRLTNHSSCTATFFHACVEIGMKYGDGDANAGDHIHAIFLPHREDRCPFSPHGYRQLPIQVIPDSATTNRDV